MRTGKLWVILACVGLPARFVAAQFVDISADVEISEWAAKGKTWTTPIHCVVGTNAWEMDGAFSSKSRILTYWGIGTDIIEDLVVTKESSQEIEKRHEQNLAFFGVAAPTTLGTRTTRVFESTDGNPGQTVRKVDLMMLPTRIAWMAFCSGPFLKREGRHIFPPSDLWKELVDTYYFTDRTATFPDALGLPETLDLYTTNGQVLVVQYRVTSSTNFQGWQVPLTLELVQYCPAPVPGRPHMTTGKNGWELQLMAKGRVTAMGAGAEPLFSREIVDSEGSSAGSIGKSTVTELSEPDSGKVQGDRIDGVGPYRVFRVKGRDDQIIFQNGDSRLLIEDPNIRSPKIRGLATFLNGISWNQKEEGTHVDFLFSSEKRDFVYIRRTLK